MPDTVPEVLFGERSDKVPDKVPGAFGQGTKSPTRSPMTLLGMILSGNEEKGTKYPSVAKGKGKGTVNR